MQKKKIYKCVAIGENAELTHTPSIRYWKVETSFFSKNKLYRRSKVNWIQFCKDEKYCKKCELEVNEDSFRCNYNHRVHSHSIFDLITQKYSYYRNKEYQGRYGDIILESKCSIE